MEEKETEVNNLDYVPDWYTPNPLHTDPSSKHYIDKERCPVTKFMEIGATKVVVHMPSEQLRRESLIAVYDFMNDYARNHPEVDTTGWFLTDEQVEALEKDPNTKWI